MQSLAENQPFVDGNKRIAWISGKVFLKIHGLTMRANDADGLDLFVNRIAAGMTVDALATWISHHVAPIESEENEGKDREEGLT